MIDIHKQISFWLDGAREDLEVARELVLNKRSRHGLFFLHLSLEKIIKAHVCNSIGDIAPRTHNLTRLAGETALPFEQHSLDLLAELNAFNIEGRYPDSRVIPVSHDEAIAYLTRAQEVFTWLMNLLPPL